MKRTLSSLLLLLAVFALSSCEIMGSRISQTLRGEEKRIMNEKTYKKDINQINLNWKNGKVKISHYDGNEILVRETSYTTLTQRTRFRGKVSQDTLTIDYTSKGIWMIPFVYLKDIEILIPYNTDLKIVNIETQSADVNADGLSSIEKINTSSISGDITLENLRGTNEVKISSTSGKISLDGERLSNIFISSLSGNVMTNLKDGAKILSITTKSGKITGTIKGAERITTESVSGEVELNIDGETKYIAASTTSGTLTLKLNEKIKGFLMTASSASGSIRCDFPSSIIGDQFCYGDKSTLIKLRTTSGKIRATKA